MERFACPTPDFRGRYRCIDDRMLCNGFHECPNHEDENPDQCLFYKTVSEKERRRARSTGGKARFKRQVKDFHIVLLALALSGCNGDYNTARVILPFLPRLVDPSQQQRQIGLDVVRRIWYERGADGSPSKKCVPPSMSASATPGDSSRLSLLSFFSDEGAFGHSCRGPAQVGKGQEALSSGRGTTEKKKAEIHSIRKRERERLLRLLGEDIFIASSFFLPLSLPPIDPSQANPEKMKRRRKEEC